MAPGPTPGTVELSGTGQLNHRVYGHRVVVCTSTGDVLRHQVIDLVWGFVFVDWRMPEWVEIDGLRVPRRVEYRVHGHALDREAREVLRDEHTKAGIASDAMLPESPRFGAWVEFRDRYFGDDGVPTRLLSDWQSCESEIIAVNAPMPPIRLPLDRQPAAIMSHALECMVDQEELEPTSARR